MRSAIRRSGILAAAAAALLIAAACGGGEPTTTPTRTPTSVPPRSTGTVVSTAAPTPTQPGIAPSPTATRPPAATPAPTPTLARTAAPATPTASPAAGAASADLTRVSADDLRSARYGGVVRGALHSPLPVLDRYGSVALLINIGVSGLFNRLLTRDPLDPDRIVPDLAESWQIGSDGKIYTFKLRSGVSFHNGAPLSAADVKATYDYFFYNKTKFALGGSGNTTTLLIPAIQSYRAVDDRTFEFTLKQPLSYIPSVVAFEDQYIFPSAPIQPALSATSYKPLWSGNDNPPVGTGPFKYKAWDPSVSIEWVRNERYWKKDPVGGKQLPFVDGFIATIISDETLRIAAFRTGRLDYYPMFPGMPKNLSDGLIKALGDKVNVWTGSTGKGDGFAFNFGTPLFREPDLRTALALLTDPDELLDKVYQGQGVIGQLLDPQMYPPGYLLPSEELAKLPLMRKPRTQAYAEARQLLDKAGIKAASLPELRILCFGTSSCDTAQVLQIQWARAGIRSKVEIAPSQAVFLGKQRAGDYEIDTVGSSVSSTDPIVFMLTRVDVENPAKVACPPDRGGNCWLNKDGSVPPARQKAYDAVQAGKLSNDEGVRQKAVLEALRAKTLEATDFVPIGWATTVRPVFKHLHAFRYARIFYEGHTHEYEWLDRS